MPAARAPSRIVYLDWFRGFAVVVMIESHVFHSFTRAGLRNADGYMLSQALGGLAAPLFLFIAGMMVGFRIDNREDRGLPPFARLLDVLKRGGYILLVAELILFQQWLFQWSLSSWRYLFNADILNAMALAIAVSAVIALGPRDKRPGIAIALGASIAALAPLASTLDWSGTPAIVRRYLLPGEARFPFFPEGAYVPFGIALGFVVRRAGDPHIENVMRWLAFAGFGLVYFGEFFSNQPYSLYPKSDFWLNSPGLVVIRTGIMTLALVFSFVWIRFAPVLGVVRQLGTTSLLVYWVHVELVYGSWLNILKKQLNIPQAALATIVVILLMYGLSVAKTNWSGALVRFFSRRYGRYHRMVFQRGSLT